MKPLAMCVMWSLLCDRVPAPDVKSEPLSTGKAKCEKRTFYLCVLIFVDKPRKF